MAVIGLQSQYGLPGIEAAVETVERQFWFGRWEQQQIIPVALNGAARDSQSSPTDLLRPGLLLGQNASTKLWMEWTPTATNGTQYILGVLLYAQKMQSDGSNLTRWAGYALVKGNLKAGNLLIPGNSSYGINGDNYEIIVRSQLRRNFLLDDDLLGHTLGGFKAIRAITADATLTEAESGCLIHTVGASGAVVLTLPAPIAGLHYRVFVGADQNVTVASAAANQLILYNTLVGESVALSTSSEKIGGAFDIVCLSSGASGKWAVMPMLWEAQTPTISA